LSKLQKKIVPDDYYLLTSSG